MLKPIEKLFIEEAEESFAHIFNNLSDLVDGKRKKEALTQILADIHKIRSPAGFLGYQRLGKMAEMTELFLEQLLAAQGKWQTDREMNLLSDAISANHRILMSIKKNGKEGHFDNKKVLGEIEKFLSVLP